MRLRRWLAGCFLLMMVWGGVPTLADAQTLLEPAGSTRVVDCDMTSLTCAEQVFRGTWYDAYNMPRATATPNPNSGGSPPTYADAYLPYTGPCSVGTTVFASCANGGGQLGWYDSQDHAELYIGAWVRFDVVGSSIPGFTKLFFARNQNGPNVLTNGYFGFSGRDAATRTVYFDINTSDHDNTHACGGPTCFPNIGSGAIQVGQWFWFEACVRSSSSTTARNGVARWWINGVAAGSYTNLNYGSGSTPQFDWTPTWDGFGNGQGFSGDVHEKVDRVVISVPPDGGCASVSGGSGGDTTPPSQVTGLSVSVSGTTASLTWSAATDNVAVQNYLVEKCTPHNCTNWALDQTVTSLSATIPGLTGGVSYDFRVRAQDTSSNLGSYSATVTGTTSSEVERTLATDDFNRANGALGANWTGSYTSRPDLTIVSNAVRGSSTSGDNLMAYTAISPPADQWAQVDVATATGSGLYAAGVTLRTAASPVASYYMCRMQANGWAGSMIEKLVNGSYTLLSSSASASWVAGDKLKCTARGSTLTLLRIRGGVESVILTATDSTHATGKTGVITYADTIANLTFDNFTTGDWATVAPAPTIASFTSDATGANVTWTGSPAYIRVQTYTATGIYDDVVEPIANFPAGRYSRVWPTGINSGCVFAQDASHVENTNPSDYKCAGITPAPPADTTPPTVSSLLPSGTLPQGTTSTTISVVTNETATCKYSNTDQAYSSMPSSFSTANGTSHSATKSGVSNGTAYTVYVRCSDVAGNANVSSSTISFSVASAPAADTTAPSTVAGLSAIAISTSQIQAAWTAATDNVAVAGYRLYACVGTGCSDYSLVASPTGTSATIAGLIASTVYRLVVDAIDTSGNISAAHSSAYEVTTSSNLDIVPPSTLMNLREASAATYNTASLTWDAGTDNVGISQTLLERCAGETCTDFQTIRSASGTTFSDSSVQFGTTYRYRGKHRDTSGNVSTNYSSILSVVVPSPPSGVTAGVCPCKTH